MSVYAQSVINHLYLRANILMPKCLIICVQSVIKMKINARVLGWKDKCCGCYKEIKSTEKVFMISDIAGVNGSIHFCENCVDDISKSKKNIN